MCNRSFFTAFSLVGVMIAALSGCGGGGSSGSSSFVSSSSVASSNLSSNSSSSSSSSAAAQGSASIKITDGPDSDFDHVWVTVKSISFHTDANAVWSKADATWQSFTLPTPITVDLTKLTNGALVDLLSGMALPIGTYRQVRLFLASVDDPLSDSALSIKDTETTPLALQWNDQVEYTDSNGTIIEAPLEIAYPTQGIALNGTFNITANSTLNIAVDFDLEHDVVPFKHGTMTGFTLKPNLHYYDLNQTGAITGQIDTSKLCAVDSHEKPTSKTNCAYDVVVKAELLTADGKRHYDARATRVDQATGKFALYPLLLKDSSNNPLTYDIVIRGRQMDSMIITGVTPVSGTTPSTNPTILQTNPLAIVVNSNEYLTQFSSALSPLTSGIAIFQQTVTSTGMPYEIRWANTDPFTGKLMSKIWLENGSLQVAAFNNSADMNFIPTIPVEGTNDSYTVATNEIAYYDFANALTPVTSSTSNFVPPTPTLSAGIENGTVNVNLTLANISGAYDSGFVVLSRFANIVTTQDISNNLASGGAIVLNNIPSGSSGSPVPGAYYYGYIRVWNSAHPFKTRKLIPIAQMIDLRKTNSATVTATLDGNSPPTGL